MQSSLHLRVQLDNVSCMTSGPLTLNLIFKGILFSFFLSLWDLPGSGIKPVSSALAGGFFTRATREAPTSSIL